MPDDFDNIDINAHAFACDVCARVGATYLTRWQCLTCGARLCLEHVGERVSSGAWYQDGIGRGYCVACVEARERDTRERIASATRADAERLETMPNDGAMNGAHPIGTDADSVASCVCDVCSETIDANASRDECEACGRVYCNECGATEHDVAHCRDCALIRCRDCGDWYLVADGESFRECDECGHSLCESCGNTTDGGDVACERHYCECVDCGYSWCGRFHNDESLCESCYEERGESEYINDYSHKPYPNFIGLPCDGLYMGVEIEAELEPTTRGAEYLHSHSDGEQRYYLKHDGSVQGYELVTHPGSLDAWRDGLVIDWDVWNRWVREYEPALEDGYNNGLHVHISRDAFYRNGTRRNGGTLDAAHVWRWIQLIYRNPDAWKRIGGRDGSSYASWHRVAEERANAHRYARGTDYPDRYSAVNFQNSATIELRFLKPNRDKAVLLGQLEWIAASVDYTRTMTYADVTSGALSMDAFNDWMVTHRAEYGFAIDMIGG